MVISYVRGRLPGLLRLADFQDKIDKLIYQELVLNSFNIFNCLFVEKKYIYSVMISSNFLDLQFFFHDIKIVYFQSEFAMMKRYSKKI